MSDMNLSRHHVECICFWERYEERTPDLRDAKLRHANLRHADLRHADLRRADLRGADLRDADLRGADLRRANLRDADLRRANLPRADLRDADLRGADLSGAKGLFNPSDWLDKYLETTDEGIVAYTAFGTHYDPPDYWNIQEGAVLKENCHSDRTMECECGVNVATREWVERECGGDIWKVLIPWKWAAGIVVPYGTDGKIRCEKCKLLKKVEASDEN